MVELPPHVHRVTKKRAGKTDVIYYFYTRGRNTAAAWPSINLPAPFEPEFVARMGICNALERDATGFVLDGRRMPDHKSKDFWPAAVNILRKSLASTMSGKTSLRYAMLSRVLHSAVKSFHNERKDFTALCDAFESPATRAWTELSVSTQRGYKRSFKMIREVWGDCLPSDITTPDVQDAIDTLGDTPATANQFRAALSRLLSWGVTRGYATANVASFSEKIPGGEPWVPWPEWALDTLLEHGPFHLVFPAVSAYFTGQRQGDVVHMTRPRARWLARGAGSKNRDDGLDPRPFPVSGMD